jgi:hypothetical protein
MRKVAWWCSSAGLMMNPLGSCHLVIVNVKLLCLLYSVPMNVGTAQRQRKVSGDVSPVLPFSKVTDMLHIVTAGPQAALP